MKDTQPQAPDGADWRDRMTDIVVEALDREGDARIAFLDKACADDPAMRAEVESLLAEADDDETAFLAVPVAQQIAAIDTPVPITVTDDGELPLRVGPYRIVDRLGSGGMGTVFLAEQDEPVRRRVALKVIRAVDDPRARDRFAAECQALARLNHPNLAAMYEVGAVDDEQQHTHPYVAMEWVDGEHITNWCDARHASIDARLNLFLGVCAGIRHAHEKGVLHCDLKPSNILVTEIDGQAVAKVIDFGIARALDEPLLGDRTMTRELFLGSPLYISPEAVGVGGRKSLDARSDVYSLGLILFELLVGVLPFDTADQSVFDLLRQLTERTATAPSARVVALDPDRLRELAAARAMKPSRLARRMRGDLDAIILKATARDPAERYGSPAGLATELRRHRRHAPVAARGNPMPYLAGRFVRRNLGVVASITLLVMVLAGGLVARTIESERAQAALAESEQMRTFMIDLLETADPERVGGGGGSMTVTELLDQGAQRLRGELTDQPLVRARFLLTIGAIQNKLGQMHSAEELVREALALREERLGDAHPDVLESRAELGIILRREGRTDEALPLLESVLAARQAARIVEPADLARAQNNLGNAYWSLRRYDEAEHAYRSALANHERIPGIDEEEARAVNNLGVLLRSRRRYAEARPLLLQAIASFRETVGPRHPYLAAALNNLALVDRNLASWAEAEAHFHEAVRIWEEAYGPNHVRTLAGKRNLVIELRGKQRWQEAASEARTILAATEAADGDDASLVQALRLLANCELNTGELEQGLTRLRRAATLADSVHGPEHPEALSIHIDVGRALNRLDRHQEAKEQLESIARVQERILGADHRTRWQTESNLAWVESSAGRLQEAETRYRRVLDHFRDQYGDEHTSTASRYMNHGRSLADLERDDEAAHAFERALAIRETVFGHRHLGVADAAHRLALIETRRGNTQRARTLLEQSVAIRTEHLRPDDDDLRASIEALAAL